MTPIRQAEAAAPSPTRTDRPAPQVVGSGPHHASRRRDAGVSERWTCATGSRLATAGAIVHFRPTAAGLRRGHPTTRTTGGHISTELRINDRIRVPEVRLVGPNGETVGIVPTDQALKLAQEADLDLVEIAPQGTPAGLQAHGLREVQVRERPEGP